MFSTITLLFIFLLKLHKTNCYENVTNITNLYRDDEFFVKFVHFV